MSGRVGSGQVSSGADGWCGSVGASKIEHRASPIHFAVQVAAEESQLRFQFQLIIEGRVE